MRLASERFHAKKGYEKWVTDRKVARNDPGVGAARAGQTTAASALAKAAAAETTRTRSWICESGREERVQMACSDGEGEVMSAGMARALSVSPPPRCCGCLMVGIAAPAAPGGV